MGSRRRPDGYHPTSTIIDHNKRWPTHTQSHHNTASTHDRNQHSPIYTAPRQPRQGHG